LQGLDTRIRLADLDDLQARRVQSKSFCHLENRVIPPRGERHCSKKKGHGNTSGLHVPELDEGNRPKGPCDPTAFPLQVLQRP
jgi:hypothetical protein